MKFLNVDKMMIKKNVIKLSHVKLVHTLQNIDTRHTISVHFQSDCNETMSQSKFLEIVTG